MSTTGYQASWFCEKPQDSAWGRYENSSMHFVEQSTESFDAYSIDGLNSELNYGSDMSFMKFALDVSLDLNPKSVIDCLTSSNEPLYADVAPLHLRNDAASEFANPTPTHIDFPPTADLCQPFVQPRLTETPPVMYATQLTFADSADGQNGFFTESTPMGFLDQQQQVEPTPAYDQTPRNEQPLPEDLAALSFLDVIQNPMVPNSSQLLSPYPTHVKDNKEPLHVCQVEGCGIVFKKRAYLQKHLQRHSYWTYENNEKKFACGICKKTFTRYECFHDHMTSHNGEKQFACDICGRTFARNGYLRKHMLAHNEDKKKKITKSKVRTKILHHAVHKTYACQICDKTFAHVRYLRKHMTVHDDERRFECDVCRKIFASKLNLGIHMVVHTKERRFACDICGMRFTQKATLTRHKAVHTGQKKFTCGVCNRDIARYDNLKAHMKIHEKVVDTHF